MFVQFHDVILVLQLHPADAVDFPVNELFVTRRASRGLRITVGRARQCSLRLHETLDGGQSLIQTPVILITLITRRHSLIKWRVRQDLNLQPSDPK